MEEKIQNFIEEFDLVEVNDYRPPRWVNVVYLILLAGCIAAFLLL